jgi:hypothetical protein
LDLAEIFLKTGRQIFLGPGNSGNPPPRGNPEADPENTKVLILMSILVSILEMPMFVSLSQSVDLGGGGGEGWREMLIFEK